MTAQVNHRLSPFSLPITLLLLGAHNTMQDTGCDIGNTLRRVCALKLSDHHHDQRCNSYARHRRGVARVRVSRRRARPQQHAPQYRAPLLIQRFHGSQWPFTNQGIIPEGR